MKANQLRIGNLVKETLFNRIGEVYAINKNKISIKLDKSTLNANIKVIEPIPLTEEWLFKLGLSKHHADFYNDILMLKKITSGKNEWILFLYPIGLGSAFPGRFKRLYYIHELQNLYFALTGEELTVKE